ncbi:MAG: tRNA (adenosine(37)-N6)-threonylcarbamoyltransferase complex transferase subunit TsaD [Bacteroidales bacterium]|nr:tRNA (adenosine(37)-N6)-threonylcarbamoyltransferase complex transferase subunit TsaD [Bacteroidales bacterium]MDZ4204191.1 tRNA (adenosine(37)-N6)-threonylcarbamoyltransferase complex transferase subunit TsaD [Bacteroidales bacterium]
MPVYILGIESSCDETSAAVLNGTTVLSNFIATQTVHQHFGGVVPELASRAHQQHIIPVVHTALQRANVDKKDLSAVAFTRGPGLLGSLLVGVSFAKSFAQALQIPLVAVDHMQAHILAHFLQLPGQEKQVPTFPFICLTVSGGHTQIVRVNDYFEMKIIGQTIDDAAGETFDKAAKIMGLPYPGGPVIDKLANQGNAEAFKFAKPKVSGYDYSFSGLKTSILYFLRDQLKNDPEFITKHKNDLAASVQKTIIDILTEKLIQASEATGIKEIAIAGGVSANSGLRNKMLEFQQTKGWNIYLPGLAFTTDNAAMIAVAGYFKYLTGDFAPLDITPYSRGGHVFG